eukprot:COSAG04_NODE_3977_length_2386_cov_1.610407_4_plen_119_part_01
MCKTCQESDGECVDVDDGDACDDGDSSTSNDRCGPQRQVTGLVCSGVGAETRGSSSQPSGPDYQTSAAVHTRPSARGPVSGLSEGASCGVVQAVPVPAVGLGVLAAFAAVRSPPPPPPP